MNLLGTHLKFEIHDPCLHRGSRSVLRYSVSRCVTPLFCSRYNMCKIDQINLWSDVDRKPDSLDVIFETGSLSIV